MPTSAKYSYWDTDVFLSYLKRTPGRWSTLSSYFADMQQSHGTRKIVTSRITQGEVVYIEFDTETGLSVEDEQELDRFWSDYHVMTFIETTEEIMRLVRTLRRHAKQQGWRLRFPDATHLASAQWLAQFAPNDLVFHTYNLRDFQKFSPFVGFPIDEPRIDQLPLLPQ